MTDGTMKQNRKFINKPPTCRNLVYDKGGISNYWGKDDDDFNQMMLRQLDGHLEKDKIRCTAHTTHKNKLQILKND